MTRIKSLGIPFSGFPHRTHRSKKNRKKTPQYDTIKEFRLKKQKLKEPQIDIDLINSV